MIKILPDNKKDCCGCSACEQICPKQCINMKKDDEGFWYPIVDDSVCIDCGLCEKVCPIIKDKSVNIDEKAMYPKAIGGWHRDECVRMDSSSGGAFSLFANYVLSCNGVICGCTLDKQNRAMHILIDSESELSSLRGSKYVQSDIGGVYSKIKEKLISGKMVLFVGAPCQAAGLKAFLNGKNFKNLYICDFICHGVPSPQIFQEYIKYIEKKYESEISTFRFRNKDKGWHPTGLQLGTEIVLKNGQRIRKFPAFQDVYMNGFLDDLYLRPSCYDCSFKQLPKYYADITIADFWGVRKVERELYDGKGTSLLLIHNSKGQALFEHVKKDFFYKECDFNKAIKKNQTLFHSAKYNADRKRFFEEYKEKGFIFVKKKYLSAYKWATHKLISLLGRYFRKCVYTVLHAVFSIFHINLNEKQWEVVFQFINFGLVGISNSIVSVVINVLTLFMIQPLGWGYDYVIANFTAFALSVLWSYCWNSKYVFSVKEGEKRSKGQTLLKTYLSYGFSGIILNNILSTIWIEIVGISKFIAPLVNLPFTIPINFVLNKFWAYRSKDTVSKKVL